MIHRIKLEHLVELMQSENYQDRFVAEYIQTKQRLEKLKHFNTKIEAATRTQHLDNGVDEPLHDCPAGLLREQQAAMGEYLHLLEVRAVIEDIDLEDAINYYIQKALKAEREYHGFTACECRTTEEIEREKACCNEGYGTIECYAEEIEREKACRNADRDAIECCDSSEEPADTCGDTCSEHKETEALPEGVMSLEATISMLEAGVRCEMNGADSPCLGSDCPMWIKEKPDNEHCAWGELESYTSPLYHLKRYAESK